MHVYPVKEDTKKQIQNLLSAKKDDLSNFNHREKNDLVLFLMEQNAPSEDIIEVINSGANQDVTVFNSVNPALSYGNLLDLSFELLTKNIKEIPYISGYCYTQLTDVQQEINGLVDENRNSKFSKKVEDKIKEVN